MGNDYKYLPQHKLSDLISDNFMILNVMSRFGLTLGFGDKSVEDVCNSQGVDCSTFLAVANFVSNQHNNLLYDSEPQFSLASLMLYLENAHAYFIKFNLPMIKRKLIEALDCSGNNNVAYLILKFYDDMVKEVRQHMEHENAQVFTYVRDLQNGKLSKRYNITRYSRKHTHINDKLNELKNLIIKYYPETGDNYLLNAVLFDIFNCEQDLIWHSRVEDCLFVPAVAALEKKINNAKQ